MGQRSGLRQLGLALILFVISTFAYWLEYQYKPRKESAAEKAKQLFQVEGTPIEKISYIADQKEVVFKCADLNEKLCKSGDSSTWDLVSPIHAKADRGHVGALVSSITQLQPTEVMSLKDDTPEKKASLLKDYGLDPVSLKIAKKVTVTTAQGSKTLFLGQPHAVGEAIFASMDTAGKESEVYLIPRHFQSQLEHDLLYWRDKRLFDFSAYEVAAFHFSKHLHTFSGRRAEGGWTLHQGAEKWEGDVEAIDRFLGHVASLSAQNIILENWQTPEGQAKIKTWTPLFTVTLEKETLETSYEKAQKKPAESHPTWTLTFYQGKGTKGSSPEGKFYATVGGLKPLFELEWGAKNRLDQNVNQLRLARLMTAVEKLSATQMEWKGKTLKNPEVLFREGDQWKFADSKVDADQERVKNTLDRLSSVRIQEFLTGARIPSGEENGLILSLKEGDSVEKRKLVFWISAGKLYAKDLRTSRKEAFLLESSLRKDLPWEKDFFQKKVAPAPSIQPSPDH